MTTDMIMAPVLSDDALRGALIRAVGFDKLSEPQRELALAIAKRYDLDPMLKHLVMIEGKPYTTRDGLLHVAHRSGDFDGIEVTDPVLDAEPDAKGRRYWRSRCTVWRKSMNRPFVYPGRYPALGGNEKFAEEMSIKVAEVMCLRRAFDVSAPTLEERWEGDEDLPDAAAPQPTSLAERVALRASEVAATEVTMNVAPAADGSSASEVDAKVVVSVSERQEPQESEPPAYRDEPEPTPFQAFSNWAAGQDKALVRAVAKGLFPDATRFADLTVEELDAIVSEVTSRVEAAESPEASLDDPDEVTQKASDVAPDAEESPPAVAPSEEVAVGVEPEASAPAATMPVLCGAVSPISSNTCVMDTGHKGAHRAGLRESW